jgi:hypothetical protein
MKKTKTNFFRSHFLRFGLESIRKSIKVFLLCHLLAVPLYYNFVCLYNFYIAHFKTVSIAKSIVNL